MRELIVDLFAGGGGASTAILAATGRHPDVAVNHNAAAIGVHQANHPQTRHYTCDVREVDPVEACSIDGVQHPVGLMWASPDCTHFSKARGGKPVEKGIRSLADVVVVWAKLVRPRLIHLENVEEFQDWGPVLENGQPCPDRKGLDFRRWVKDLQDLGYAVDWRELVAADYGAPTTRKRLFLIARCDGEPIRWPEPTHASRATLAKGDLFTRNLKQWRAAAEIIDWSIPVPSIFTRKRPLKPKTQARIAKGLKRYVIDAASPFIVPVTHTADASRAPRSADEPLQTITRAKGGELAVAAPHITKFRSGSVGHDMGGPLHTVTANGYEKRPGGAAPLGLASALLTSVAYGDDRPGAGLRAWPADGPMRTVTGSTDAALASVYLERANTHDIGSDASAPARTVTGKGHQGVVKADLAPDTLMAGASVGVGGRAGQSPPRGLDDPLHTVTAKADRAAAIAFLQKMNQNGIGTDMTDPLVTAMAQTPRHYEVAAYMARQFGSTVSGRDLADAAPTIMADGAGGKTGIVAAAIDKYYGSGVPADVAEPLDTATDKARFGLASAFLEQANTGVVGHSVQAPVSTILAAGCHQRLIEVGMVPANDDESRRPHVISFLWEHFGEPTEGEWADPTGSPGARLKFGLVIIGGQVWQIVDVGMRMLVPRELFNAQGFPFWEQTFRFESWHAPVNPEAVGRAPAPVKSARAKSVASTSPQSSTAGRSEPAAVSALIDLGRGVLQLRRTENLPSGVPSAELSVDVPLPIEIASAARMLAPQNGGSASAPARSPPSAKPSTPASPGVRSALSSGVGMTPDASDAVGGMSIGTGPTRFTTSPDGQPSPSFASILETLFSFVTAAIASCTPDATSKVPFSVELKVQHHYVIDTMADGTPVTKTAQTSMAGNSVSPPPAEASLRANLTWMDLPDRIAA